MRTQQDYVHDFASYGTYWVQVMKMQNSKDMLTSLLKTAQMGQTGIRSVLDTTMSPGLRRTLECQLQEYDRMESEAHAIAGQRGWELRELEPAVKFLADRVIRVRLSRKSTDSHIADMMIQGNTRGMIRNLKNLHQYPSADSQISLLSRRLVDCERSGIRQLQSFL